jgi:translin
MSKEHHIMDNLDTIIEKIRATFMERNAARDLTLNRSRELIRFCSLTIRAVHREEFAEAEQLLNTAKQAAAAMKADIAAHPELYYTGYTQDALKELTEACCVYAIVQGKPIPSPAEIEIDEAAYLNGLAEAASELRRRALDLIRRDRVEEAERMLTAMDDIYAQLVTIDFPDALTGGLRRTTDTLRAVLERTRGDLTTTLQQEKLQKALREVESVMREK